MPLTRARAVIFDLDGVLTDTAEFHYLAWQRLADEHGIAFDRAANEALRGVSRRDSLRLMLGEQEVDEATFDAMMERKNRYYLDHLEGMGPKDALEGAVSLVVDAKRRGLKVAIGSSSKNAGPVLDALGIAGLFDAVADGHTVEQAKPAPDLFLAAAELLGEPPSGCVVVEDAGSGVDAALAAGMTAVGVGPADRVGHAHHRFDTTAAVDLDQVVTTACGRLADGPALVDGWAVLEDRDVLPENGVLPATGNGFLAGTPDGAVASTGSRCSFELTRSRRADEPPASTHRLPDGLVISASVAGAPTPVHPGHRPGSYRFDLRYARHHRSWVPGGGPVTRVVDECFASLDRVQLVVRRLRLEAPPGTRLALGTGIDARSCEGCEDTAVVGHGDGRGVLCAAGDRRVGVANAVTVAGGVRLSGEADPSQGSLLRSWEVEVGATGVLLVDQVMAVHTDDDVDDPLQTSLDLVREAIAYGYEPLLARHAATWDRFWTGADVRIDGDLLAQTLVRYDLYRSVVAGRSGSLPEPARGIGSDPPTLPPASPTGQALVAAGQGRIDDAYRHFEHVMGALVQPPPAEGEPEPGAAWRMAVFGFGGVGVRAGTLVLDPHLPSAWERMRFVLDVEDGRLELEVGHDVLTVSGAADNRRPIRLEVRGEDVVVASGEARRVNLRAD